MANMTRARDPVVASSAPLAVDTAGIANRITAREARKRWRGLVPA
jgi:hypothetical protein